MDGSAVTPELIVRAVLELGLLLAVLAHLLVATDLRRRLYPLGAGAVAVLWVFVFAWGAVQAVDRWQYDYPGQPSFVPLTRFAMYQAQLPESVEDSYLWSARDAGGEELPLNFADEFETIGLPPMSTRMRVLLDEARGEDAGERERAAAELDLWAAGVAAALEDRGESAAEIGFSRVTGTPAAPEVELVRSWAVVAGAAEPREDEAAAP
ncbi:hypothetical protein [Homoserinibacter sp. YIM 151385]|uniref:hypothetical protein n=1 Tax=Homoserinibacter sp. YIM 151385 TaxID=2985506 RepID=UPI0022F0E137|nr:hypothetical protein [Homoserinibacter sp. YIM 151385]WBU37765.1 hypothetical protein OF852_12725 [Homoserinibacter sp. YIM 151385]